MALPSGVITIWSGSIASIPSGWVICDGNNGTPDLRDRWVVGAGSTYAVNDTGGALTHTHSFTGDGHTHTLPGGANVGSGGGYNDVTGSGQATGTTDAASSKPPYHALAFIMKT